MPSIVNGLFSARSGIGSHGAAIAVVGDNISNANTVGYKTTRTEFSDLIAGGQASGRIVGSGSTVSAISTVFEQGTLEFTSRPLDLAIDGNGFFVVADGAQRYYTRAGNFKLDSSGNIVTQNGLNVLGFPANGTGALETLNVNTVSQDNVSTTEVVVAGNVDARADEIAVASIPAVGLAGSGTSTGNSYTELNDAAEFSTVVDVFDTLGAAHTITFFFFHTDANEYTVRGYVNSEEVDPGGGTPGEARQITISGGNAASGTVTIDFASDGTRSAPPAAGSSDISFVVGWTNGSSATTAIDVSFDPFTQFASSSNIQSITQNGQGIGTVGSVNIEKNGDIFAILSNGQTATIGTIGLVNFSNAEGLTRVGGQLLQQSPSSGEPVVGRPTAGTFGAVSSGSVELSTVDIATEFVKLITLQRGFQANSRIITTINQLLNEIIQLA